MGAIRTIIGILLVVFLVVVGYWLYVTYTTKTGDDEIWVTINSNMPEPLRKWSCIEVRNRAGDGRAPEGCAEFWTAGGDTTGAPEVEGAPGGETDTTAQPAERPGADALDREGMGSMDSEPETGGTGQ